MFKTTNYKIIPIHITIVGLCCSSCWLVYGILSSVDWNIIIPNALGKV